MAPSYAYQFCVAAEEGDLATVRSLLMQDPSLVTAEDQGWTALASAAQKEYEDVVRILLQHGADMTKKKQNGWTPLLSAVQRGHEAVVRLLLKNGANPATQSQDRTDSSNARCHLRSPQHTGR